MQKYRTVIATLIALFFYTITDILIWQRIFEANNMVGYANLYHTGWFVTLAGYAIMGTMERLPVFCYLALRRRVQRPGRCPLLSTGPQAYAGSPPLAGFQSNDLPCHPRRRDRFCGLLVIFACHSVFLPVLAESNGDTGCQSIVIAHGKLNNVPQNWDVFFYKVRIFPYLP